jgi:hypothetical protein
MYLFFTILFLLIIVNTILLLVSLKFADKGSAKLQEPASPNNAPINQQKEVADYNIYKKAV